MGLLNVSELLFDPLFIEDFTIERRVVRVDSAGFQDETITSFQASGSIQAGGIQAGGYFSLIREADLARIEGDMIVYTSWELTNGKGLIDADILINQYKQRFTITKVRNWGNYGNGYIEASLSLIDVGNNGLGGDETLPQGAGDDPFS